ncbi:MAG: DUF4131 domain-containing protein, partial [Patescibacteria group bacterium]
MRDTLLLAGVLGFTSGILCRSLFNMPLEFLALVAVTGSAVALMYGVRRHPAYLVLAIVIGGSFLGVGRIMLAPSVPTPEVAELYGTKIAAVGKVIADPDIRETTQRVTVEITDGMPHTRVLVVVPLYPSYVYGQTVSVEGKFTAPKPFETDGGRGFRYDRFLAKDGITGLV